MPDSRVFIATARDISYDAEKSDEFGDKRRELDARRSVAIQKYLNAQTSGRPMAFEVLIHDPAETNISGVSARNAILSHQSGATGSLGQGGGGGGGAMSGQQGGAQGGTQGGAQAGAQGGQPAGQ
jgi:hypothetical protein